MAFFVIKCGRDNYAPVIATRDRLKRTLVNFVLTREINLRTHLQIIKAKCLPGYLWLKPEPAQTVEYCNVA